MIIRNWYYNRFSIVLMVLPSFLICGAQKAGTTALYSALRRHPDVCMSRPKETEFFSWRYRRGWEWFGTHFDHYDRETAIGEASTRTMPTPEAPARIAERMPGARLIFLLRDPVERAHSAFWYYITRGILCPGESFEDFIRNEGHPLRQEIIHYGFYDRHLSRFFQYFDDSQCLLLRYENLRADPRATMQCVCRFIGVDLFDGDAKLCRETNVTKYPTSQPLYALGRRLWKPVQRAANDLVPSLVDRVRSMGKRWFLRSDRPALSDSARQYLRKTYAPTMSNLEQTFNLDLAPWRSRS